ERSGEGQHLLLPSREQGCVVLRSWFERRKEFHGAIDRCRPFRPILDDKRGKPQILDDSEIRKNATALGQVDKTGLADLMGRPAGDVSSLKVDLSCGDRHQTAQSAGDGTFPGAIDPQQRKRVSLIHTQVEVTHGRSKSVTDRQVLDRQQRASGLGRGGGLSRYVSHTVSLPGLASDGWISISSSSVSVPR